MVWDIYLVWSKLFYWSDMKFAHMALLWITTRGRLVIVQRPSIYTHPRSFFVYVQQAIQHLLTLRKRIVLYYHLSFLRHTFSFQSEKDSALYPETSVMASVQLFRGYKKLFWELALCFLYIGSKHDKAEGDLWAGPRRNETKDI